MTGVLVKLQQVGAQIQPKTKVLETIIGVHPLLKIKVVFGIILLKNPKTRSKILLNGLIIKKIIQIFKEKKIELAVVVDTVDTVDAVMGAVDVAKEAAAE